VSPYQEVDHTADWALRVWAPSLADLFVEAAHGMYALAGAEPASLDPGSTWRPVEVTGPDDEALLVGWLQELLYLTESEDWVLGACRVLELAPGRLRAEAAGQAGRRLDKVIKAVTYHNLAIRSTDGGYETTLVFDV
jgi:SHS2 domain-containing protein